MSSFIYIAFAIASVFATFQGTLGFATRSRRFGAVVAGVGIAGLWITLWLRFGASFAALAVGAVVLANLLIVSESGKIVWTRPLTALLAALGSVAALIYCYRTLSAQPWDEHALSTAPAALLASCGTVVGDYTGRRPFAYILVVIDPGWTHEMQTHFVGGLKAGIGRDDVKVATEILDGAHPQQPQGYLAGIIITAIQRHPDCDLVVSTIPVPMPVFTYHWQPDADGAGVVHPKFAILNAAGSEVETLIKARLVIAAVTGNPKPQHLLPEEPFSDNITITFHRNFLLVDNDNIDEMKAVYPLAFGQAYAVQREGNEPQ